MSACATPWAIPPWRWPSTSSGLRITPQSSTHTIRTSRTLPVSVSTSTTATCAPNGQVGDGGLKSSSIASSARRGVPSRGWGGGSHQQLLRRDARDVEDAAVGVELDVGRAGLELVGDHLLCLLEHLDRRAVDRRAAGLQRARAVRAGPARDEVGGAVADRDLLERDAEPVGDEHRERGLMALPGRTEPGADRRAALLRDLDAAPLGLGEAVRDLDVGR